MITRWIFGQPTALPIFVEFCLCAGLVVLAGTRLSRYGHWIGDVTGLSGAWVGMVLLACATSLPELATTVGTVLAVAERHAAADLVFGDLFGSCTFNLLIIVLLDALSRKQSPLALGRRGQVLTAAGGAAMLGIAAAGIILVRVVGLVPPHLGMLFSVIILVSYFVMVRIMSSYERAHPGEGDEVNQPPYHGSTSGLVLRFVAAAGVIVATGLWLAKIGEALALVKFRIGGGTFMLGESVVGTLFLAVATSLPEVVVTVAAFRMGAVNMALGNLFGSNVFNVAIIPACDLAAGGRLFASGSTRNLVPLALAVVMTGVAVAGLMRRRKPPPRRLSWNSAVLLALYIGGMIVLLSLGSG